MKRYKLLSWVIVTLFPVIGLNAQVNVQLHQPPPNQLKVEHLWWVDLNNTTKNTYSAYLHVEVTEARKGLVAKANSNSFSLPPGMKRIKKADLTEITDTWYNRDFAELNFRTGAFPSGDYTVCIFVMDAKTKKELGKDCIQQQIAPLSPPRLIAPKNGDTLTEQYPSFTWTPPTPLPPGMRATYHLKIVEILPGQTKEEALGLNPAWFEKIDFVQTSFRYPPQARVFAEGKEYAWQVQALTKGEPVAISEIWGFGRAEAKLIPIDKIVKANEGISRYHLKIEYTPLSLTKEGEVDGPVKSLHFRIKPAQEDIPPTDFYIKEGKGFGRNAFSRRWFRIKVPEQFVDYLQLLVEIIKQGKIGKVKEENRFWKVEVPFENIPPRDNPEQFYRSIFGEPKDAKVEKFITQLIKASMDLKVSAHIWISQQDYKIKKFTVESWTPEIKSEMVLTFSPSQTADALIPAEASRAPSYEASFALLFFRLPSIQGWCSHTHRSFAKRSIDLIREEDTDHHYSEIYANTLGSTDPAGEATDQHHPLIIGSQHEDSKTRPDFYNSWLVPDPEFYFKNDQTRDCYHFGGGGTGLKHRWFFDIAGYPNPPINDEYYYSARDWGYGITARNRMTFTAAISQYGRGTFEGKRAAYLMLGHVLHLLQDQAMPDHATLTPHPGSSMTDPEAYSEFHLCLLLFAEIEAAALAKCLIGCAGTGPFYPACVAACEAAATIAAGIALAICEAAIDPDEMGYECLVREKWSLSRVESQINATGVRTQPDYNSYFGKVDNESRNKAKEKGLSQPLGLTDFVGLLAVCPLDPNIDSDESSETDPYLELTDEVAIPAVCLGAGFLQHFYEIVNPPPYAESITISQDNSIRFAVSWKDIIQDGKVINRERQVAMDRPLYPGIPASLKVIFGPQTVDGKSRKMANATAYIEYEYVAKPYIKYVAKPGGMVIIPGLQVPLSGSMVGGDWVYAGTFEPPCVEGGIKNNQLKKYVAKPGGMAIIQSLHVPLKITGTDDAPHLPGRNPLGNKLDTEPGSIARASPVAPYNWQDYQPGTFHTENIKTGIVDACWCTDSILTRYCGGEVDLGWTISDTGYLQTKMKIYEEGTAYSPVIQGGECGRYRIVIPDEITKILEEPYIPMGATPDDKGKPITSITGPPSQFGLSFSLDDPYSITPELTIHYSGPPPRGTHKIKFNIPITVRYELNSGGGVELCKVGQKLEVISLEEMLFLCAKYKALKMKWAKKLVLPWEPVILNAGVIRTINVGKFTSLKFFPDPAENPGAFAKTKTIPGQEVIFLSSAGVSTKKPISDTKLAITQTQDPRVISFQASSKTAPGMYLIPFTVEVDNKPAGEFEIILNVGGIEH